MRIKYYSDLDMSIGYNLRQAEICLNKMSFSEDVDDINTILELYNITKLIGSGVRLEEWDESTYKELSKKSKLAKGIIGRYCNRIEGKDISALYKNVDIEYNDDFFGLLEEYNVFKTIGEKDFASFLETSNVKIGQIFKHRKIVKTFDNTIKNYMVANNCGAEQLIIHYYSAKGDDYHYNIPKTLSDDEKRTIISHYIDSESANTNYLSLIEQPISDTGLALDDRIRFSAHKRIEELSSKLFTSPNGLKYGAEVSFADVDEDIRDIANVLIPKFIYSRKWVEENQDYPTLLNNLIYMFGMVDRQCRCTFVSNPRNMSAIEKHIGIKSRKEYMVGIAFYQSQIIQLLNLYAYDEVLKELGLEIEHIIKWFFYEYLQIEFGVEEFVFNPSSAGASSREKCRNILGEMESVIRQFNMYAKDGSINRELFEFASTPISVEDINSLLEHKYAYLNDENLQTASNLLFSDQTLLGYTERTKDKYNTLYELLLAEDIYMDDYAPFQVKGIQYLLDGGYIMKSENGAIILNKKRINLLKDFYHNEVVCTSYYKNNEYLQSLIAEGKVETEGTLLSRPEQRYFDYIFNRHKFTNGLDLRNRYMHGSNPLDERPDDYYRCLLIMLLIVIKINEEFCLKEKTANNQ